MSTTDNRERIYFRNLDVLRFLAAYMIVLLHCFFGWRTKFGHPPSFNSASASTDKLELIFHNLAFGVDVFFLISGFLITYLLLSEHEKTGKVDVLKFYIRRAFRIWPLYFFMILTAPVLSYFFFEQSPDYSLQFFFLGNFDIINQGMKSVATNHLWSICIEEYFYLFVPLLIAFIPVKKLPQFLFGIIFISILFRAHMALNTENYGMALYVHTLSRIDVLAIGSLFGYLYFNKKIQFNNPLSIRLMVYSIFIFIFLNVDYAECGTLFTATFKKYFFVLIAAYAAGNFLFHPKSLIRIRKPNFLHQLGKASYGIYMFNPVIVFLALKFFAVDTLTNYIIFLAAVHIAVWILSTLSYRFFEMPFLALKEKYAVIKSGDVVKKNRLAEAVMETPAIQLQQEAVPADRLSEVPAPQPN
jgi:peptidoglycan/LPS O-acetylase OafA/YrhL